MGLVWNGRSIRSQASAFSLFWLPQNLLPISSHTRTFQGWGEPQPPRTPRGGARTFPGAGPSAVAPGMGMRRALPGANERALLLKHGAARSPRGPLTVLSPSQSRQRRVKFPLWSSFILLTWPSSHCDFALLPTQTPRGLGAPQEAWVRSSSGLSFRDSCRKEGNSVFSLVALFPLTPTPNLQGPWLASLAGSRGPKRWGKEASGLLSFEAQPPESWAGWATPPYSPQGRLAAPPGLAPSGPALCKATGPSVSPGLSMWGKECVSVGVSASVSVSVSEGAGCGLQETGLM